MVKALSRHELMVYAREGAQARIEQLRVELASLEAAFGSGLGRGRQSDAAAPAVAAPRVGAAPHKRKLSAAGRKRIADAAKKRWAKWRSEMGRAKN